VRRLVGFLLVSGIALLLAACSGSGTGSSTTTTATLANVTQDVPSDWITYSEETAAFSISYPKDWEVFALDEAAVAEVIAGIEGAPAIKNAAIVFQAGLPLPDGFDPGVTVVIEALPEALSADEYAEAAKRGIKSGIPSYASTEQVKTAVAGREMVLVHASYEVSDLNQGFEGRLWMIQGLTVDGSTGWTVTCSKVAVDSLALAPDLDECTTIVRTFKPRNA